MALSQISLSYKYEIQIRERILPTTAFISPNFRWTLRRKISLCHVHTQAGGNKFWQTFKQLGLKLTLGWRL